MINANMTFKKLPCSAFDIIVVVNIERTIIKIVDLAMLQLVYLLS